MADTTLVTIHGYWSSPATWERLNDVWRADEELSSLRIHPFGYLSPKKPWLPFSVTRIPDYDDIAQTLATEYATVLARASDIAVVTHSQGGLVLQRFLAWMVGEGRARELSRIRSVVMLACPNGGSEYLRSLRRVLGYGRHPQAGNLSVLNRQVADTQRIVLQRIVNAAILDDQQCRIPFHVYSGASDNIVKPASAQAAFPGASTIAGNHSTILDPSSPGNRTAEIVKHHLLADITTPRELLDMAPAQEIANRPEDSPVDKRTDIAKYVINTRNAHGLQIGDHNVQRNVFSEASTAAGIDPSKKSPTQVTEPFPKKLDREPLDGNSVIPPGTLSEAGQLSKHARELISKAKDSDADLFKSVGESPSSERVYSALARAWELETVSGHGCRVDFFYTGRYLRFKPILNPADLIAHGGKDNNATQILLEEIDGTELRKFSWEPGMAARDISLCIAEAAQVAGCYPGDELFDASRLFADLSALLSVGHVESTAGRMYPAKRIIQLRLPQWAVCEDGLYRIDGPFYQIAAWRLGEDWWSHMLEKPWLDRDSLDEALTAAKALNESGKLSVSDLGQRRPT